MLTYFFPHMQLLQGRKDCNCSRNETTKSATCRKNGCNRNNHLCKQPNNHLEDSMAMRQHWLFVICEDAPYPKIWFWAVRGVNFTSSVLARRVKRWLCACRCAYVCVHAVCKMGLKALSSYHILDWIYITVSYLLHTLCSSLCRWYQMRLRMRRSSSSASF